MTSQRPRKNEASLRRTGRRSESGRGWPAGWPVAVVAERDRTSKAALTEALAAAASGVLTADSQVAEGAIPGAGEGVNRAAR